MPSFAGLDTNLICALLKHLNTPLLHLAGIRRCEPLLSLKMLSNSGVQIVS